MITNSRKGFTLVELVVAASLFIIIVFIASGSFVEALKTERKIIESTSANNAVTQAMEQMAREIRTGSDFDGATADQLNFTNYRNQRVAYRLEEDGSIGRCEGLFCLSGDPEFIPITDPEINIQSLKFFYEGIAESDGKPPRITIIVSVEGIQDVVINFQTSVNSYNIGS